MEAKATNHRTGEKLGSQLPRRRLGRSELIVPVFALGGYPLGQSDVSDGEAIEAIHYALCQGIDYFDTSPYYGESERRFGLALAGVDRNSITISTKTGTHPERRGDYSWDGTMWSVENSLRLLKTDYLDLVLVHDVPAWSPDGMKSVFAERGALAALEGLKAQGVIRAIGLGQKRFDFHQQAIESGRFDVILTFNNYHPLDISAADWLLPLAKQHDVGVLNGAVMAHGLLTGQDPEIIAGQQGLGYLKALVPDAKVFYAWCQERDIPMPAVIFQFSMRQKLIDCTLTGVKSRRELEENLHGTTMPLPEGIWDELAALGITYSRYDGQPEEAKKPAL
jgi:aryl-alcohol dehydrogenase-like predicted oxidoreductase